MKYEVAGGTLIENVGGEVCWSHRGWVEERRVVAQVCGVNKSLLSVRKVVGEGGTVVFKKGYGWIEDDAGEILWLIEKDGMYIVKVWVKKKGFLEAVRAKAAV